MENLIATNPMLPAVALLKIEGFKSKLPYDFVQLLAIETLPKTKTFLRVDNNKVIGKVKRKTHDTFMCIQSQTEMMYKSMSSRKQPRAFCIKGDEIYFTGGYSKNVLVRWVQKLIEKIKPEMVILKYININQQSYCR